MFSDTVTGVETTKKINWYITVVINLIQRPGLTTVLMQYLQK